jgi:hypothetical protein
MLEHLPTVQQAKKALDELDRVSDAVFITYPSRQSIPGWLIRGHHIWVWQKNKKTYLQQRGRPLGDLEQQGKIITVFTGAEPSLAYTDQKIWNDAEAAAKGLFGDTAGKVDKFVEELLEICRQLEGKDFYLVHNPGGWGCAPLERCLEWEKSIVFGVCRTMHRLGYDWVREQYFRSVDSFWGHVHDLPEQGRFFFRGRSLKAKELAVKTRFIHEHVKGVKIIFIGVSQGAAFSNCVMRNMGEVPGVYSIELGTFFPHLPRRVITKRTLVIDSNGVAPDPVVYRNLRISLRAYFIAPLRWFRYWLQGRPERFTDCINVPGHDYNWEYPAVHNEIIDFLEANFGNKTKIQEGQNETRKIH